MHGFHLMFEKVANITLSNKDGASSLHFACHSNEDKFPKIFTANGAKINSCQNYGMSTLHVACQIGHLSTVKLLVENRADVRSCTEKSESPLLFACSNRHVDIVQMSLDERAVVDVSDIFRLTPLPAACFLFCRPFIACRPSFRERWCR